MDKPERKAVVAVEQELSDAIERLLALHEYLNDFLNPERKNDEQSPNNSVSAGK